MTFRRTIWLALLAVWCYTIAPALAAFAPEGSRAACAAAPVRSCCCPKETHAAEAPCCCKTRPGGGSCSLKSMPCEGGAASDTTPRTPVQQEAYPSERRRPTVPVFASTAPAPHSAALREVSFELPHLPPRATA